MSVSMRDQAISAAGQALADALDRLRSRDPREAARAAWVPGGPTVDQIEARIRAQRDGALEVAS